MKKILIFVLLFIPLLMGCTANSAQKAAVNSDFGMNFQKLDNEKKEASFNINGLANEEEFTQVEKVIIDSMKNEKVAGAYSVKVYASAQEEGEEPIYGTAKYQDGKLTDNKLKNITMDQYINITTEKPKAE